MSSSCLRATTTTIGTWHNISAMLCNAWLAVPWWRYPTPDRFPHHDQARDSAAVVGSREWFCKVVWVLVGSHEAYRSLASRNWRMSTASGYS